MSGPEKMYETVIIIAISKEKKAQFKALAGSVGMSRLIRRMIEDVLDIYKPEKMEEQNDRRTEIN